MTKKQHYMTEQERYQLEGMLRAKMPVAWIARELGFTRQTIYNEIKRGTYLHTMDFWEEPRYSAAKGQDVHIKRQWKKGRPLKIGDNQDYADYLEHMVIERGFSPAAALASARAAGFEISICINTMYNYIDQGVFFALTNDHLWEKPTRKPRKKNDGEPKIAHKELPSIEQRPQYINERSELGHWEMDLVVGPQGSSAALLTLTERVTREEVIIKIPDHRAVSVRKAINRLERHTPDFKTKFKSISTDNGSEFMEYKKLVRSIHGGKRFEVYYCHSYAAWEKGTNENHNRMIRRFFPKGTDFTKVTKEQVAAIQNWMNDYPRKVLGWKTPKEMTA